MDLLQPLYEISCCGITTHWILRNSCSPGTPETLFPIRDDGVLLRLGILRNFTKGVSAHGIIKNPGSGVSAHPIGPTPEALLPIRDAGVSEADLRKGVLSAAGGGALQWHNISILVDPKQISVGSKI